MQCSQEEALARFFYNISSFLHLLFLFIYISSSLLSDLSHFLGSFSLFNRNRGEYDYSLNSEDEEVDEEEEEGEEEEREEQNIGREYYSHARSSSVIHDDLVADIIHGGEALSFLHADMPESLIYDETPTEEQANYGDVPGEENDSGGSGHSYEQFSAEEHSLDSDTVDEEIPTGEEFTDSPSRNSAADSVESGAPSPVNLHRYANDVEERDGVRPYNEDRKSGEITVNKEETKFFSPENGRLFTHQVPEVEAKNFQQQVFENDFEEIFGDSCTVGSTSKSSSEWRIHGRDSGTDDPFSSSSRRSCPKWESYTVFQKYDEEMMFLDRLTAQKLQETESLRSIKVNPRSISERIVHKISTRNKRQQDFRQNPYHQLEAAYVAEICLTWEALNWNYKSFQDKRATYLARDNFDPGCPAQIAQHFQQFQVLLQRYIENEPYEQGRRPEVYARMRLLATKLLQVPEYRDSEDINNQQDEEFNSRISSAAFLMIIEEGIRTFMNFLKADKVKPCQILASFFLRNRRGPVDPALLALMRKVNKKKKMKLKDLRRTGKCIRVRRKLNVDAEMEILMGLIDLKVVSRVLRMADISEEQLHWREEKMSKVRVWEGKLQRDSSPLFFPPQTDLHNHCL